MNNIHLYRYRHEEPFKRIKMKQACLKLSKNRCKQNHASSIQLFIFKLLRMKYLNVALCFILLSIRISSGETKLLKYEYWFNDNYQEIKTINFNPVSQHFLDTSFDISTLPEGLNVLNIRCKDEYGIYSSTISKAFFKYSDSSIANKKLNAYEYWFNEDYIHKQVVNLSPTADYQLTADIAVANLPEGLNVFNIRYKDQNGIYSSTISKAFFKYPDSSIANKKLNAYEYWFNEDYIHKQVVNLSPTADYQLTADIAVANLPEGLNVFNIRYKDQNGIYSSTISKAFFKYPASSIANKKLNAYEYWFNEDYVHKQVVNLSPTADYQLTADIAVANLPEGLNVFNIRYKDQNGIYSSTISQMVYVQPHNLLKNSIRGYRYWLDNNMERTISVNLQLPSQSVFLIDSFNLSSIRKGIHTISIQFVDSLGIWSVPVTDTIEKLSHPVASYAYTKEIGCDSTIIHFTNQSIDGDQYLWKFGDGTTDTAANPVHKYIIPGNYTVSLTTTDTVSLADSTVSQLISINANTYGNLTAQSCDSYISPSGKYIYTESGVYTDTLINQHSCDSIITINLTINKSVTAEDSIVACGHYTWINGITYYSSTKIPTFTLKNSAGCDSIVTLNLTINNADTTVVKAGKTLTAQASNATYQWVDCNNGYSIIQGARSQSFTPVVDGSYAVIIEQNGCKDTSSCYVVDVLNIIENSFGPGIVLYPNPTSGKIRIDLGKEYSGLTVNIINEWGQQLRSLNFKNNSSIEINLYEPKGLYFIKVFDSKHKATFRVIKN
jgi:PKD repeat protein